MLLEHGLADEVFLFVYPVLLGKGKRLFSDGTPPSGLSRASTTLCPLAFSSTPTLLPNVCVPAPPTT